MQGKIAWRPAMAGIGETQTGARTTWFSAPKLRRILGMVAVSVGLVIAGVTFSVAQELPKASAPVLVTSLGQSLDAFQVQLAVRRAKIPYEYKPIAEVDLLGDKKTLFLAVGASLKGFGDAGISIDDELARAGHLLDAAEKAGILVVMLHVGGAERRDGLSNQLIELVAPRAKAMIIRNDSDADGLFTRIAKEGNIPVVTVANVQGIGAPLQQMFGEAAAATPPAAGAAPAPAPATNTAPAN